MSLNEASVSSQESHLLATKPNIIFILVDDMGYEIPTCNGGQSYLTPNIDLLSKNGMRFTECYSLPMCSPSRVQIVTGKYSFRNYIGWGKLDTTQRTFANMLQRAGYSTCYTGKWELDGGDNSIHKFGFDKYRIWLPYNEDEQATSKYRYKNPKIYENGKYLPDSQTAGKYGDDLFVNYVLKFIDSNLTKPFFVMYATNLVHAPFGPTPDDPEFATWDFATMPSSKKFFPSMVKYMDKEIQKIINGLNSRGLANNTVIVVTGDNGTPDGIVSLFKGQPIAGGKSTTTVSGTHVPLIVSWPSTVHATSVSNALTDFSDFLPTFAGIAKVAVPTTYGKLDGVSFVPALNGSNSNLRSWVFGSWMSSNHTSHTWIRWVQDETYKLYDSVNQNHFYNFIQDPLEQNPILKADFDSNEIKIKNKFTTILNTMH